MTTRRQEQNHILIDEQEHHGADTSAKVRRSKNDLYDEGDGIVNVQLLDSGSPIINYHHLDDEKINDSFEDIDENRGGYIAGNLNKRVSNSIARKFKRKILQGAKREASE